MTTTQLSQRLARNLNVPDAAQLEGEALLDVLAAINAGLAAFYREMPSRYRQTTLSGTLKAPANLSLTFAAKYGNTVQDNAFTAEQRGCTVRVSGQSDNEITGTDSVLDDYLGDTLMVPATVYADVLPIRDAIKRVTGAVRLYVPGQQRFRILREGQFNRMLGWYLGSDGGHGDYGWCENTQVGEPRFFQLDAVGAAWAPLRTGGTAVTFFLRVFPKPSRDYTVRFEAELSHRELTVADMNNAAEVPVAHDWVDDILVPLCEAELASSKFWQNASTAKAAVEKRADVIANRISRVPGSFTATRNQVGTPAGY